jgi:hypothetical protein
VTISNTQRLGSIWRGRAWDDGYPITRVSMPDDTEAEGVASLTYGWDATSQSWVKVPVDHATGALTVVSRPKQVASATVARVSTSTASASLLASNASRLQAIVCNEASAVLYVSFGSSASTTSYVTQVFPGATLFVDNYTGQISGVLATGSGNAQVTEL